jgi:LuxR family maltose regulon positive regulatory protein
MHTGLADMAYQRGELEEARSHLEAGRRLGDEVAFLRDPYRSRVVEARIRQAEGDVEAALALLGAAERLYVSEFAPDVRPVAAIRARVLIAHGRLGEAREWARRAGVSTSDEISYVREFEHTTLARLLVEEASGEGEADELDAALGLLDRLVEAAEEGSRDGSRLDILVTQALARQAAGDEEGGFGALDAAVALAQPDGYVRLFLDEGPAMTRLLKVAARRPDAPAYLQALARTGAAPAPSQHGLIEPLSERELEVLRLLRSDLDGPELARELVVSLNTLRTHTKNVYSKLGVGSRRAAVRRGEELGLI